MPVRFNVIMASLAGLLAAACSVSEKSAAGEKATGATTTKVGAATTKPGETGGSTTEAPGGSTTEAPGGSTTVPATTVAGTECNPPAPAVVVEGGLDCVEIADVKTLVTMANKVSTGGKLEESGLSTAPNTRCPAGFIQIRRVVATAQPINIEATEL